MYRSTARVPSRAHARNTLVLSRIFATLGALGLACLASMSSARADDRPEDRGVILQRARGQLALANYEVAIEGFENLARLYPADDEAPTALKEAIVLRLGMGQLDLAGRDAELFLRTYGSKQPSEAATVLVGVAQAYADHDEPAVAKKLFQPSMDFIDRAAPLDKRLVAHALLGRSLLALGAPTDRRKAEEELDKVRALWKDPAAAVKTFTEQGVDTRRVGQALNAVGEAYFFFAEQKRAAAEAIPFPAYTGRGDHEDVLAHLNTKVVDWVKKKRPAIELAEREYLKIVDLQPVAPPRWVIASAARVGQMWGHFVTDFRAAPLPKEWSSNGPVPKMAMTYADLRKLYFKKIDEAAEPHKRAARGAFVTCLRTSIKFQYFDAHAESCAEWLSRNYKSEFPRIDELRPRSGLLAPPGLSIAPLPEPK